MARNGSSPSAYEASVVGAVLIHRRALALLDDVEVDDFRHPRARRAWAAIRNLQSKSLPVDIRAVETEIPGVTAEDVAFLGEAAAAAPGDLADVRAYADAIRAAAFRLRVSVELHDAAKEIVDDDHYEPAAIVRGLREIADRAAKRSPTRDDTAAAGAAVLARGRASALVDELIAWGQIPPTSLFLPTTDRGAQELLRLRIGAMLALIGGSGQGKSSLVLEMLRCHARWSGPAVYIGLELAQVEALARLVGQHELVGWLAAAELHRDRIAAATALDRLFLFGREAPSRIVEIIRAAHAAFPGEPILVAIDYVQILGDLSPTDERMRISAIIEWLRVTAKVEQCLVVALSQTSRSNADALRSGEKIGAETTATGAETAQLERAAYVTLALGEIGEDDGHGWRTLDLNVGKSRMGEGDRVIPLRYHGASGRFAIVGESEPAAKVRSQRKAQAEAARAAELVDAVAEFVASQGQPVATREIEDAVRGRADDKRQAIRTACTSDRIVQVQVGKRGGGRFYATRERARALGLTVVQTVLPLSGT